MREVHDLSITQITLFRLRVAQFFGISVRELLGGRQRTRLGAIRRDAQWVLLAIYRTSEIRSKEISGYGGKPRRTRELVAERRASDPTYAVQLDELVRRLAAEIPPPPT